MAYLLLQPIERVVIVSTYSTQHGVTHIQHLVTSVSPSNTICRIQHGLLPSIVLLISWILLSVHIDNNPRDQSAKICIQVLISSQNTPSKPIYLCCSVVVLQCCSVIVLQCCSVVVLKCCSYDLLCRIIQQRYFCSIAVVYQSSLVVLPQNSTVQC